MGWEQCGLFEEAPLIGHKGTAHFVTQSAYTCAEVYTFLSNFDTLPRCVDGIDKFAYSTNALIR